MELNKDAAKYEEQLPESVIETWGDVCSQVTPKFYRKSTLGKATSVHGGQHSQFTSPRLGSEIDKKDSILDSDSSSKSDQENGANKEFHRRADRPSICVVPDIKIVADKDVSLQVPIFKAKS